MQSSATFSATPQHATADYQVSGAINFATVAELAKQAKHVVTSQQQNDHNVNVIDMSAAEHCNSAAVAWLLELQRHTGQPISLLNPPQQIVDILAVSGLSDVFPIHQ